MGKIREALARIDEELMFMTEDKYDKAIIGIAHRCGMPSVVAYDTDKVIDVLMEEDGMTHEEAIEFHEFNQAGAYMGERTPMFIDTSSIDMM